MIKGSVLFLLACALSAENVPGRYIIELSTEPVADHVARLAPRPRMQSAEASAHRTRVRPLDGGNEVGLRRLDTPARQCGHAQ